MSLEFERFNRLPSELEEKLDGKIWKSPDFSIATEVILQPGRTQNIPVIVPSLDPFTPRVLSYGEFSVRSRYAQFGIDILHSAAKLIGETQEVVKAELMVSVPIRNHSARPVNLPEGTRLFRFFMTPANASLDREKLLEMVENGKVRVGGERGRDWEVLFTEKIGKLWLKLDPYKILWMPPHPDSTPITIPDQPGIDYRTLVDGFLEAGPISEKTIHWVGETVSQLGLNSEVSAIIDRIPLGRDALLAHGSEHINSLLLDGGSPEWPIRTELLSSTSPGKIPEYILLRFLKS